MCETSSGKEGTETPLADFTLEKNSPKIHLRNGKYLINEV
jgi:hypothetical protein